MLAYTVDQCFPTFLQLRHTYLEPVTSRHTAAFLAQISELRLKYTHKIPTKFQICNTLESVLISDIVVEVCRGKYVENERLSMRVDNFSHGTLVCRGTQVGKHWCRVYS